MLIIMNARYRYAKTDYRTKLGDLRNRGTRFYSGLAILLLVLIGSVYYTLFVTLLPIEVNNSMPYMTPKTIALSMQPAVSRNLADRRFILKVNDKETEFRLGDFEFTASPYEDGFSQDVTYKNAKGKEQTKTITTVGTLCFNETAVHDFIYRLAKEYGTPMIAPKYKISGDKLTVYKGSDGVGIDYDNLIKTVSERIKEDDYSPIATKIVTLTTPEVDIDKIYSEVRCSPSNAYVTEDSAGKPSFTADIIGKDFDLEAARNTIQSQPDKSKWTIKLTLTYPEISLKEVRAPYCLDVLSTCTTSYKGSSKERTNNVEQAASNVNTYGDFTDGFIMQPGEEFSFNKVVGERTAKNGFMKAPVYLSSGSSEDYGGGICQVSTTIYCAALYANLQITERHNHIYVIHYWPTEGCDATVDWGHLDFRFKNNKDYPIKIKMTYENKKLTATITGTEDGIKAKMTADVESVVPYQTYYKYPNADNPEGKTIGGDKGKTIRVWKSVYQDGKLVEKKKVSYDAYQPLDKTVYTKNLPEGAHYGR